MSKINSQLFDKKNPLLKIRLTRVGKNNQPNFRLVIQEHTSAVKGKFIEVVGAYRATKPSHFEFNSERIKYWISVGAQPSDTVACLLKNEGFDGMAKFIAPRDNKRKRKNGEPEPAPAAPAPAAPTPAAPEAEAPAEVTAEPAAEPEQA